MTQILEAPTQVIAIPAEVAMTPRRPHAKPRAKSGPIVFTAALAGVAVIGAWVLAFAFLVSPLAERSDQHRLYTSFRELLTGNLLGVTAPVGGVMAPGSAVAVLNIPQLGLNGAVVVEGTSGSDLTHGPGHLRTTVLPGQVGLSAIFGRAVTFGAPFGRLGTLRPGDTFSASTGQGTFKFRVVDVRRSGDPLPPALGSGASRLVLVSAEGKGALGWLSPSRLVYVDADLVGTPVPNNGALGSVPDAELPWGTTTSGLVPLVFWLQALLLAGLAMVWALRRWSARQAWVVGVPVIVAILVGATTAAYGLLPNLL